VGGYVAPVRDDFGGSRAADQGEGQVAQGSHDLGGVAAAQAGNPTEWGGSLPDTSPQFDWLSQPLGER